MRRFIRALAVTALVSAVTAFTAASAISAATAAPAARQAPAVQLFNCFGGPHAVHAPRPGQFCWQGGLALSIPIQGQPPDTRWTMSSTVIAGVRYLQLDDHASAATDDWTVVFVGWVRDGPAANNYWPFRNPVIDRQFVNYPVILVKWSPHGNIANACIDAPSISMFQRTATGPCSGTRQNGGDPHASFVVFKPGQRLNLVQLENASQGGNHAVCPTVETPLEVGQHIINFDAASNFEHEQQWHFKPVR